MSPKPSDWDQFYSKMRQLSGLDLHQYKAPQLQRRTIGMVESKKLKNLEEFALWLALDKQNVQWYMDKLAINVSELFRNPERWREIETKVIPELLSRSPKLKAWSAGCSYGAEAYTLSMILTKFPGAHQIIGTDIDEEALSQARRGEFSNDDLKYVPQEYKKFLTKGEDGWTADRSLARTLNFKKQNILSDRFDSGFDLIMCRNVVIYFTDEAKEELYKRFFGALKPGGYLFVGSTERIQGSTEMGYETALPFMYQKPLLGVKQWQNAS